MKKIYPVTILSLLFFLVSNSGFSQKSIAEKMRWKESHKAQLKRTPVEHPLNPASLPYNVDPIAYAPYAFEGTDSTIVGEDE